MQIGLKLLNDIYSIFFLVIQQKQKKKKRLTGGGFIDETR